MKKINELHWKEFDIIQILPNIMRGKRLKTDDHIKGTMPYVSSSAMDNGVDNFVANDDGVRIFKECLTIANSGSVGATFYHPYSFVASDHVTSLANPKFNKYIYLFLAVIARRMSGKYCFNREIKDSRIKREKILLPINDEDEPDYVFMEKYMKHLEKRLLDKYKGYLTKTRRLNELSVKLPNKKWRTIKIEAIGEVKPGRDIYEKERIAGKTPYVTATALQNGIGYFVGNKNESLSEGCISVNRNGSVGYSFYHPYKALFGNDTRRIVPFNTYPYANFFITRAIMNQKDKYGYGLKMGTERLKNQDILLPVDKNEEPDYKYMAQYMKNVEIGLLSKYINYRLSKLGNDNI